MGNLVAGCGLKMRDPQSSGDAGPRAVAAMAAAVVFDAVARQATDNVTSVLSQAPGGDGREESRQS